MTATPDPIDLVSNSKRVALLLTDGTVRFRGTARAYIDHPTVVVELDDGSTKPWSARLVAEDHSHRPPRSARHLEVLLGAEAELLPPGSVIAHKGDLDRGHPMARTHCGPRGWLPANFTTGLVRNAQYVVLHRDGQRTRRDDNQEIGAVLPTEVAHQRVLAARAVDSVEAWLLCIEEHVDGGDGPRFAMHENDDGSRATFTARQLAEHIVGDALVRTRATPRGDDRGRELAAALSTFRVAIESVGPEHARIEVRAAGERLAALATPAEIEAGDDVAREVIVALRGLHSLLFVIAENLRGHATDARVSMAQAGNLDGCRRDITRMIARLAATPPAPEGESGSGIARRGLGDPYPIAQAIDGVTADLDASLSPRVDLVRVLLDVANTYIDRLIVEARTWTTPAPGCRCRDPLREVNALCPSHGHSPELADTPAAAGPAQVEGAGETDVDATETEVRRVLAARGWSAPDEPVGSLLGRVLDELGARTSDPYGTGDGSYSPGRREAGS